MRILHAILSDGFYGSERYCIELAMAQARAGHAVTVLARNARSDCVRQFRIAIDAARAEGGLSLAVIPGALPTFLQRPWAALALRRARPDIVHTHLNPAARRVGMAARRFGLPHVTTLHLDYEVREHGACDGLICIANWQHAALPPDYRGQTAVVWNWLPDAVRKSLTEVDDAAVAALRTQWTANDDTMVFGSVGRLMPAKGMDVLVYAFRAAFASADLPPARLVLVGDGPMHDELHTLAGGDPRVIVAGHVADVAPYYRAFDVAVSAARYEPFGLTILEAMAAGCPLVATRTQGPQEFVTDARTRWAALDDAPSLGDALITAARNGRRRFAYDLTPFGVERAANEVETFYRKVIAAKTRQS